MSDTELKPVAYLRHIANGLAQREEALGTRPPDGPSSEELLEAANILDAQMRSTEPTALLYTKTMHSLASVADKWIDPEADPLGHEVWEYLEKVIHLIKDDLDRILPESIEQRQRWDSLRVVARCAERADRQWKQRRKISFKERVRSLISPSGGHGK